MADEGKNEARGFALVSVLWGVAVLSLIAATVFSSSALTSRFQKSIEAEAVGHAIAGAGITRACLALFDERAAYRWRTDGMPETFSFAGYDVEVAVQDELGLIDLNATDFDTLRRLLVSADGDSSQAEQLAARILDWREADGLHRLKSEMPALLEGNRHPRHGPFQSVDELLLVPGITVEMYSAIAPALTVFSQKANVDPSVAPVQVLKILPGMDEARMTDILSDRERLGGLTSSGISLAGRSFAVQARVEIGRRRFQRSAVVRVMPRSASPCLVLFYR